MAFKRVSRVRMTSRKEIELDGKVYKIAGGLEEKLLRQLSQEGIEFEYEPGIIRFPVPAKAGWYKPDLVLTNGIIIEGKGLFPSKDRQKHLHAKAAHPDLDVRFVFSRSAAKIGKKSETTYGLWCERNGYPYADKVIPEEWLNEPPEPKRIAAAKAALVRK